MTGAIGASVAHPGFADPVQDSQACFRAVLDAMARPGQVHRLSVAMDPPPGLDPATAAVLLTLADAETPVWLDPAAMAAGGGAARDWLAFHCGALVGAQATAVLACAAGPVALDAFDSGTDEAPERGATLILQVEALGRGTPFVLAGPGLAAPASLAVLGLPDGFAAGWAANRALFPRGVDVILCAGRQVAALPRTVAIGTA